MRGLYTAPMQSKATSVTGYLAELPPDRRAALEAVRRVILKNLDKDFEEGMAYGMIGYAVPHRVFPAGYHCDPKQPLPYAALASQKNYMSVYLMCVYGDSEHAKWFREAWARTGKKLDMGKSCIRFKRVEDLALEVIGESIRRIPAKKYIEFYLKTMGGGATRPAGGKKKAASGKGAASKQKAAVKRKTGGSKKVSRRA